MYLNVYKTAVFLMAAYMVPFEFLTSRFKLGRFHEWTKIQTDSIGCP